MKRPKKLSKAKRAILKASKKRPKKKATLPKPVVAKSSDVDCDDDHDHKDIIALMFAKDLESPGSATYQAGEYSKIQREWVEQFVEEGIKLGAKPAHQAAHEAWARSLKRAWILSPLSMSELKKRRFVGPGCSENPFQEIVQKAFSQLDC